MTKKTEGDYIGLLLDYFFFGNLFSLAIVKVHLFFITSIITLGRQIHLSRSCDFFTYNFFFSNVNLTILLDKVVWTAVTQSC